MFATMGKIAIELTPRELLEQLTCEEIGEILDMINLPKETLGEEALNALSLILPMAKGYAYKDKIEANMRYIRIAEKVLKDADDPKPAPSEKGECECEKPQRCNHGTGLIGWTGDLSGYGECNLCHKCEKLIDPNFGVVKPIMGEIKPSNPPKKIELVNLEIEPDAYISHRIMMDKINELVKAHNERGER